MAALCPGVQYGLSSQGNFGENKDLIFVKLTDSAYRAIEDYFKNQNKFNQSPTIQFLGNEGQLSFPSEHGSNGCASFNFSISSTADMEGPGGSFECVQQCGPPRGALEVLGALPHKMRIHANDDVYEATRHRMTVAEENHKNKCTRVIKPNQTDIGRKVKVKQMPGRSIPIPKREPPPLSSSSSSIRESLSSKPSTYNSSSSSNAISNNSSSNSNSNSTSNTSNTSSKPAPVHSSNNGLGSNHVTSSRPQNKPSSRDSDIMRRPIKERLIHLLALRPYKKPELVERINRDGREKNAFTTVLKQIAFMRDNTYHLHQHMWNDVNDEWPYYTEQEKQLLKRRKPQNLTPPGSSDGGSSGSGQSPTSTHPGSPPPPVTSSVKRPGYYDGADGLPTKRPRISHYRKPEPATAYNRPAAESNTQRRPVTDSRDASNMNPRSREGGSTTNGYNTTSSAAAASNGTTALANSNSNINSNNTNSISSNDKRQYSDDETEPVTAVTTNRKRACDSHSVNYITSVREKTFLKENNSSSSSICSSPNNNKTTTSSSQHHHQQQQHQAVISSESRTKKESSIERSGSRCRADNNDVIVSSRERDRDRDRDRSDRDRDRSERDRDRVVERDRERSEKRWNKVSSTTHNGNNVTRVSPDSQADRILPADPGPPSKKVEAKSEFPDYLTEYTTIKNVEQRRRYKADFNADYAEYRDLHAVVETVSRRFAQLEERLKQEDQSSQGYKDIKKQIVRDYKENQRDDKYQKSKRRFQYLHDKLSHIKRLVLEYDQQGGGTTQTSSDHCNRY